MVTRRHTPFIFPSVVVVTNSAILIDTTFTINEQIPSFYTWKVTTLIYIIDVQASPLCPIMLHHRDFIVLLCGILAISNILRRYDTTKWINLLRNGWFCSVKQRSDNCLKRIVEIWIHDDVIKWKHFPRYWPFVRGIHRSLVNSPHKGQWRGAFNVFFIYVWINGWINNREAGDLRRYRAHYDVIVMSCNNLVYHLQDIVLELTTA